MAIDRAKAATAVLGSRIGLDERIDRVLKAFEGFSKSKMMNNSTGPQESARHSPPEDTVFRLVCLGAMVELSFIIRDYSFVEKGRFPRPYNIFTLCRWAMKTSGRVLSDILRTKKVTFPVIIADEEVMVSVPTVRELQQLAELSTIVVTNFGMICCD
jgi:hypothetical protein